MAKLQIAKTAAGVRITDVETGTHEDVRIATKTDEPVRSWLDETPVIETDEPELSGRLHYRA